MKPCWETQHSEYEGTVGIKGKVTHSLSAVDREGKGGRG